jgi:Holliday junction resolvase
MKNINYIRGRGFEYRVAKKLRISGWVVTRVFGSFGPYDLHASRGPVTWVIQCKWSGLGPTKPGDHDLAKLIRLADGAGLVPVFAGVNEKRHVYFVDLRSGKEIEY